MSVCLSVGMSLKVRKRVVLELEVRWLRATGHACWEPNSGPPEGQQYFKLLDHLSDLQNILFEAGTGHQTPPGRVSQHSRTFPALFLTAMIMALSVLSTGLVRCMHSVGRET